MQALVDYSDSDEEGEEEEQQKQERADQDKKRWGTACDSPRMFDNTPWLTI